MDNFLIAACMSTAAAAVAFADYIGTLPDHGDGRYYLDAPEVVATRAVRRG